MDSAILQSCRSKKAETMKGTAERVEQILAIHIGGSRADQRISIVDVHIHGAAGTIRVPGPALDRVTAGSIVGTLIRGGGLIDGEWLAGNRYGSGSSGA